MKRDTSVNIRLTQAERDELQRRADVAKRTLSDYIRLILRASAPNPLISRGEAL